MLVNKETTIKVAEIVDTIESEGMWAGLPVSMLSVPDCVNECPFCKWLPDKGESMTVEQVAKATAKTGHVLLSCGEALLQGSDAVDFVCELSKEKKVILETAGSEEVRESLSELLERKQRPGVLFNIRPGLTNPVFLSQLDPELDEAKIVPVKLEYYREGVRLVRDWKPRVWTNVMPFPDPPQEVALWKYFEEYRELGFTAFEMKLRMGLIMHMHVGIR